MVHVNLEKLGGLRVVECDGRIVRSDSAFALRDCVTSQSDARVIVLDLSEVNAIEGGGLGMLMFLQRWAQDHDIRLKLFNPRISVELDSSSTAQPFPLTLSLWRSYWIFSDMPTRATIWLHDHRWRIATRRWGKSHGQDDKAACRGVEAAISDSQLQNHGRTRCQKTQQPPL